VSIAGTAFNYPLKLDQGGSLRRTFTWKLDGDTPVDLTGCTATLEIRATHASPAPALSLTSQAGEIVLGGAAGTVEVIFSDDKTQALTSRQMVYGLEIYFGEGTTRRLLRGRVDVQLREVTA
jgi:hypothetical protein